MQLFSKSEQKTKYEVVYNLYEYEQGLFLPNAYIVSKDQEGYLAHIQQKALKHTLSGFGLELDPRRESLFEIIEELQPKNLEKKYNANNRRPLPLQKLLADKNLKSSILRQIHRKLNDLLQIIVENQLPISWEMERRVLAKDFVMELIPQELEPSLFFRKSEKGIEYELRLGDENGQWTISGREVVPITNHPAWLFVDYQLRSVAHINGNMVKPFRTKDKLFIPKSSVRTYFQKFILKIASRLDIDAEGFDILQQDTLLACQLEPVEDLFQDFWGLSVKMIYEQATFSWNDKRSKKTLLDIGEKDDINLVQIIRNKKEEANFLQKLGNHGLTPGPGNYFLLPEKEDLLGWLSAHRRQLEKDGFQLLDPVVEEKKLYLQPAAINLDYEGGNDWFDLHGEVVVGEFSFPFLSLASYIRSGERYYPLPNGTFFLIPEEWMVKYKELVSFGKKSSDHLRIAKSQFTILKELGMEMEGAVTQDLEEVAYHPSNLLKARLRPYQLEGVKWLIKLYQNQLGACLADDMGLGKTLQTIAALLHAKEKKGSATDSDPNNSQQLDLFGGAAADMEFLQPLNALIILPASLVYNWEQEIRKFAPALTAYRHVGNKRYKDERLLTRFDVLLTTYQTALRDIDLLEKLEYEYIVLDESQQIKNKDSKVFKAINKLTGRHKVSLSGTPIENSLSDLWAQMQFINPQLLGSFNFFKKEFIRPIEKLQDEDRKAQLRRLVEPYLLRRTKEEVAKDLPPLSQQVFYSEMTNDQKKLYEKEKSAARNYLLENYKDGDPQYRMIVLQTLTRLRQMVNHPGMVVEEYTKESGKFIDVLEHFEQIRKGGHKVLIFSSFVKYLNLFKKCFEERGWSYSWLTGSLTAEQRKRQVEQFEKDPSIQTFFISIKAGGTGLNLTAADYVFILDPWWNPTIEQQAIARAHRIGQKKNVFALKFITKDSIEEKILKLQDKKLQLAEDIIGKSKSATLSKKDIEYLLN